MFAIASHAYVIRNGDLVTTETLRGCLSIIIIIIIIIARGRGRAIAHAVSRPLPNAAARVQSRVWSCGIL
jgi:hypothetical protein